MSSSLENNQLFETIPNNWSKIVMVFIGSFAMVVVPILLSLLILGDVSKRNGNQSFPTFLFIGIIIYSGFFLIAITKFGEWAAKYPAKRGMKPISSQLLKEKIVALSDKYPVEVVDAGMNKLKIRWNYADEKFKYLFGIGHIYNIYELFLKLDASHNRLLSTETEKRISINAAGLIKSSFKMRLSIFKGISLFAINYGKGYGFQLQDGKLIFDKLYKYSFNVNEIKAPIIALTTENGWKYKPKVWLR